MTRLTQKEGENTCVPICFMTICAAMGFVIDLKDACKRTKWDKKKGAYFEDFTPAVQKLIGKKAVQCRDIKKKRNLKPTLKEGWIILAGQKGWWDKDHHAVVVLEAGKKGYLVQDPMYSVPLFFPTRQFKKFHNHFIAFKLRS